MRGKDTRVVLACSFLIYAISAYLATGNFVDVSYINDGNLKCAKMILNSGSKEDCLI